ncbi:MAG: FtsX-like permease family protein [Ferruginibacter sp.]
MVFVSQPAAIKYFGKEDPLGRSLVLFNQFGKRNFTVGGIYSIPENSDIKYDMVFSLETLKNPANLNDNSWAALDNIGSQFIQTYFLLNNGVDHKAFENTLTAFRDKVKPDKDGIRFRLQPLTNIHLAASLQDNYQTTGNLKYVYIISVIALLILSIAWFNYINLSTANALKRAGEVGVRKVIGASRSTLVFQFLTESILVNIIGFIMALFIIQLMQPLFNSIIDKQLSLSTLGDSYVWVVGLALLLSGSVLSGAYTAFALSGFKPIDTIKAKLTRSIKGATLRKSLVVGQFTISIALILCTALIYQQLQYMQTEKLGINTEQVMVIRGPEIGRDSSFKNRKTAFLNSIAQQSYVNAYTQTGNVPGNGYNYGTDGFTQPNSKKGDEKRSYSIMDIDDKYVNTYQAQLKAGRNFSSAECLVKASDNDKVILNERAVEMMGFASAQDALQTKIQKDGKVLQVVGVIQNYHHTGLQNAIESYCVFSEEQQRLFFFAPFYKQPEE